MKQHPDCSLCQDTGLVGGNNGMEFCWCGCEAGAAAKLKTPELVNEANANLERLKARFA